MASGISSLSLVVSVLYFFVVIAAGAAAANAGRRSQQFWHLRGWIILVALFCVLIALRLLDGEEIIRDNLREILRSDTRYESRRDFQRPLVAGLVAIAAVGGFFWIYRVGRRVKGRRNIAVMLALACGAAMVFLVALRMISLHAIDAVLYGPLKLNWVADVGLSCAIVAAACFYAWIVTKQP